jgi:hypothetical protein
MSPPQTNPPCPLAAVTKVNLHFEIVTKETEMVQSLSEILKLQTLIDTAIRDTTTTTCIAKYLAVPKRFAIVVPIIKYLVEEDKRSTANALNINKWKMQMEFL